MSSRRSLALVSILTVLSLVLSSAAASATSVGGARLSASQTDAGRRTSTRRAGDHIGQSRRLRPRCSRRHCRMARRRSAGQATTTIWRVGVANNSDSELGSNLGAAPLIYDIPTNWRATPIGVDSPWSCVTTPVDAPTCLSLCT